jgi:hypothetical protein
MRTLLICFSLAALLVFAESASAATGKVVKVLPHFLDQKGRHALTPSLYDRDAYQEQLRKHPDQRTALRFDVQWRARGTKNQLKLKAELRGTVKGALPRSTTLEKVIERRAWSSGWAQLKLAGDDYKNFGDVSAWRVTLWDGEELVAEQKSFLW